MTIQTANPEMAGAWDGEEGAHWAGQHKHYDVTAQRYNAHLLEAASLGPTDRVLDIGCGNGSSTRDAARVVVSGSALGVDLSSQMIDVARALSREEGLTNVTFEQADAQVYRFDEGAFDAAISRFGAMFFSDPVAAFRNIGRGLRSGGRLSLSGWYSLARNEWLTAIREALASGRDLPEPPTGVPGPFGLGDPDQVRQILIDAGYGSIDVQEVTEPMCMGTDADDAYGFVSSTGPVRGMLHDLDEPRKREALDRLRTSIAAHETSDGVFFGSTALLISATNG